MATAEVGRQVVAMEGAASPKLELTRVIRASRARVFEAWTRPEIVHQWFGPGLMEVQSASLDLKEGGEYVVGFLGTSGACEGKAEAATERHAAVIRGEYRRIVPNELLQFTWCGDWDPTEISLVTVRLRDVAGGTELTLTHEQFATEISRDKHERGWGSSLAKLVATTEV